MAVGLVPVDLGDRRLEEVVEEVEVGLAEGDRLRNSIRPAIAAPTARTTNGMVITGGDSCRWLRSCALPRNSPSKVMNTARNM